MYSLTLFGKVVLKLKDYLKTHQKLCFK